MTVWKYDLEITDVFTLTMPLGARILHAETQYRKPRLWAWVDETASLETRTFAIVGTGNPAPAFDDAVWHATFFHHEGTFVWHLFEEIRA